MFSVHPNIDTAKFSRQAQAKKVKKSIGYLIQECVTKLKLSDIDVTLCIGTLDKIDRLSPAIHHSHHALQSAMRNQDISLAKLELYKLIDNIMNWVMHGSFISVSSIGSSEWERFIAKEAIRLTEQDCNETAIIDPISESELSEAKDLINASINLIAKHDSEMFDEVFEQVIMIKLFNGKVTMGLTDVRMLGAMFIRLPRMIVNPILYFFEHIIHEASHIHLNCLMAIDPLILNLPDERFVSPLRPDLRPMIGVFHATFVSTRIVRSLVNLYKATNNSDLLHPLAESIDEAIRGIIEIQKSAKLTDNGQKLVDDMVSMVESAILLYQWKNYDFKQPRSHRFGVGKSKVEVFGRYFHEYYA